MPWNPDGTWNGGYTGIGPNGEMPNGGPPGTLTQPTPAPAAPGSKFDWSKLTPDQQAQYAQLTQAQRLQLWNMPQPGQTANLTSPYGGPQGSSGGTGGSASAAQMLAANPGMQPWVADAFVKAGITPGPRGSGDSDWQYWQNEALNGAHGDTAYIAGRITGGGGGGGGGYGSSGTGSYSPLGMFQGAQSNLTQFGAPSFQAASPFQYGGPNVSAPSPFSFNGITPRQPMGQQAMRPQPQAPSAPPPQKPANTVAPPAPPEAGNDPFEAMGGGVYMNGGWVPKSNQAAQQYIAQNGTPDPAAQSQYDAVMKTYQAAQAPTPSAPPNTQQRGYGGNPGTPQGSAPVSSFSVLQQMDPQLAAQVQQNYPGQDLDRLVQSMGTLGGIQQTLQWQGAATTNGAPGMGGPAAGGMRAAQEDAQGNPVRDAQGNPVYAPDGQDPSQHLGQSSPNEGVPPSNPYQQTGSGDRGQGPQGWAAQQNMYARPNQGAPQSGQLDAQGLTLPLYKPPPGFNASAPFQGSSVPDVGSFSSPSNVPNVGSFTPTGQISAGNPFNFDSLKTPDTYTPTTFTAPTADEAKNDPGYQFRLQQGSQALQNSAAARGTLLTGGTAKALQDYGQASASQEYQNVYGRDFNTWQQNEGNRAQAAAFNAATGLAAQGQQYGQAANTYGMNQGANMQAQQATFANALAGYNTNAQTGLQQQAQQYGQAANTYGLNSQTALQQQAQQYGQASNTYGMNDANAYRNWLGNQQVSQSAYGLNAQTQLGAESQAFNQALSAYQTNAQVPLSYQQNAYNQAYNTWAGNAQNQLAANQSNLQASLSTNALNAQQQQQDWQNNYQQAWDAYQSQVQQGEYASGLGLQAQGQYFNQGLQSYDRNYQSSVTDPFNQNFAMAQLGVQAINGAGNLGAGYASNAGNTLTGIGNVNAAGQVGSAAQWQNLLNNLGPMWAGLYGQATNPYAPKPGGPQPVPMQPHPPTWGGY